MVELIRLYSNKESLRTRLADLRKRIEDAEPRPPETRPARRPCKRQIEQSQIDEICQQYASGISTNQLLAEHHIAKGTILALLRANGVVLRPRGRRPPHLRP